MNHKKVLRLYREEGLTLWIPRQKRKHASWVRVPLPRPTKPNQQWTADFVSDALADGRRIRVPTVLDVWSRECLALEAAMTFPAIQVTRTRDTIIAQRGTPTVIALDHGTEFTGRHFDAWAYQQGIGSTSSAPDARSRMRSSSPSMGGCETSASTLTGGRILTRHRGTWKMGDATTTK